MSFSLYEICTSLRLLADEIDQSGEELTDDQLQRLQQLELELPQKVDGYCALRREWEAYADAADEEAKRLKALAQVKRNAADRLWKALATELAALGLENYRTQRFYAYFQKSPPAVKVDVDAVNLPALYQRITITPDLKELAKAARDGLRLPDGVRIEQGTSLRLK